MLAQQTQELTERAIVMPVSFDGDATLPGEAARAGRLFSFDVADGAPDVSSFTTAQVAAAIAAASPGGSGGTVVGRESGTLSAGSTVITLTSITYTPGVDAVLLVINGFVIPPADYTETSTSSLTLDTAIASDVEWEVIAARHVTSGVDSEEVSLRLTATAGAARSLAEKNRDWISLADFDGIDPTGATSSQDGVEEAVAFCKLWLRDLKVNGGKYLIDGNIQLANIRIFAEGGGDHESPYNTDGAQFWQTDTTLPMFFVAGNDVELVNLTFYYPDQDGSTATPIAYEPTIELSDTASIGNLKITGCSWLNAYKGIKAVGTSVFAHGRIQIHQPRAFCFDSFMELGWILDLVTVSDFMITPGMWQDVAIVGNQYPWKWISDEGRAFRVSGRCDGLWLNTGIIFGYQRGLSFESASGATNDWTRVSGVLFDQCSYGVIGDATHGRIASLQIVNGTQFYTRHSFDASADTTSIELSGSQDIGTLAVSGGNIFGYSQGSHISLPAGDALDVLNVTGNMFFYWAQATGLASDKYAIFADGTDLDIACSGNTFFTGGSSYSEGVWIEECTKAAVLGNTFTGAKVALRINGAGAYTVVGNVSTSSGTSGFQASGYTSLTHTANSFDSTSVVESMTTTLDFPSVAAGSIQTLDVTVAGCLVNDAVSVGLPASGAHTSGVIFQAWVSVAGTVRVAAINPTAGAIDPASMTVRLTIHPR